MAALFSYEQILIKRSVYIYSPIKMLKLRQHSLLYFSRPGMTAEHRPFYYFDHL